MKTPCHAYSFRLGLKYAEYKTFLQDTAHLQILIRPEGTKNNFAKLMLKILQGNFP